LMRAAANNQSACVKKLLASGASHSLVPDSGFTALRMAASRGHCGPARLLLEAGAPIDEADHRGRTALALAVGMSHLHMVELLLAAGANTRAQSAMQPRSESAVDMQITDMVAEAERQSRARTAQSTMQNDL
jgi:ankyrin repeat protein